MKVVDGAVNISEDGKIADSTQLALTLINQLGWRISSLEKQIQETGSLSDALSLALLNASVEAVGRKGSCQASDTACGLSRAERAEVIRELHSTREKIIGDIGDARQKLEYLEGSLHFMVGAIRYLEAATKETEIKPNAQ